MPAPIFFCYFLILSCSSNYCLLKSAPMLLLNNISLSSVTNCFWKPLPRWSWSTGCISEKSWFCYWCSKLYRFYISFIWSEFWSLAWCSPPILALVVWEWFCPFILESFFETNVSESCCDLGLVREPIVPIVLPSDLLLLESPVVDFRPKLLVEPAVIWLSFGFLISDWFVMFFDPAIALMVIVSSAWVEFWVNFFWFFMCKFDLNFLTWGLSGIEVTFAGVPPYGRFFKSV